MTGSLVLSEEGTFSSRSTSLTATNPGSQTRHASPSITQSDPLNLCFRQSTSQSCSYPLTGSTRSQPPRTPFIALTQTADSASLTPNFTLLYSIPPGSPPTSTNSPRTLEAKVQGRGVSEARKVNQGTAKRCLERGSNSRPRDGKCKAFSIGKYETHVITNYTIEALVVGRAQNAIHNMLVLSHSTGQEKSGCRCHYKLLIDLSAWRTASCFSFWSTFLFCHKHCREALRQ
jgi:hypothetical protein